MASSHPLRELSTMRPVTATSSSFVADHRFSGQDLVDLVGALGARAASHPDNPGLVACWPAVPEHRMAAACRLLARRGHPVQRVSVAGWEAGKTRGGWALATPRNDHRSAGHGEQACSDTERWTNEGGSLDGGPRRESAHPIRPHTGLPEARR